jgi:hypothetical protein
MIGRSASILAFCDSIRCFAHKERGVFGNPYFHMFTGFTRWCEISLFSFGTGTFLLKLLFGSDLQAKTSRKLPVLPILGN